MYNAQPHQPKHHYRFYTVLITLVIAGIFFLLLMNDNTGDGLTSLTIGNLGTEKSELVLDDTSDIRDEEDKVEEVFSKEMQSKAKEVDLKLRFNQIPAVKKEAKIKDMELAFDDLTTKIKVNDDRLELSNLKKVSLRIKDFNGEIDFNEQDFSVEGTAKSIAVNDVKLSTKGEIKISFDGLNYKSAVIDDIVLTGLELSHGDGILNVAEKLQYALEQEEMKIYYFNGRLAIQRDFEDKLELEGVAKGISVSGALLDINLR